jgi:hypothetical protein
MTFTKLYTIVGASDLNGVVKTRFANGSIAARAKVLDRNGHTAIQLVPLPRAMTKIEARDFWLSVSEHANAPVAL